MGPLLDSECWRHFRMRFRTYVPLYRIGRGAPRARSRVAGAQCSSLPVAQDLISAGPCNPQEVDPGIMPVISNGIRPCSLGMRGQYEQQDKHTPKGRMMFPTIAAMVKFAKVLIRERIRLALPLVRTPKEWPRAPSTRFILGMPPSCPSTGTPFFPCS